MAARDPQASRARAALQPPRLGVREFALFRKLIAEACGIRVAETKGLLLQNRIGRRLRALGLDSFEAYLRHVQSPAGRRELPELWSVVTTHETHFFREKHHFDALAGHVVPALVRSRGAGSVLRVWSAGCATGQEPYTLAMVLERALGARTGYRILGSDIDVNALDVARGARYPLALLGEIPAAYARRAVQHDERELWLRDELRAHVSFACHNFSTLPPQRPRFDVIFCRNAMMYLEREVRHRLLGVFCESLADDGALFVGTAESLLGSSSAFTATQLGKTTVWQKASLRRPLEARPSAAPGPRSVPRVARESTTPYGRAASRRPGGG